MCHQVLMCGNKKIEDTLKTHSILSLRPWFRPRPIALQCPCDDYIINNFDPRQPPKKLRPKRILIQRNCVLNVISKN